MTINLRSTGLGALICLLAAPLLAERPAPFSLAIGTQSIGVRYQFSEDCAIVESAKRMAAMGSDTLKIAFTPKYDDDYRLRRVASVRSITDLTERFPGYLAALDMPFRNLMLWVYPFSDDQSAFTTGSIAEEDREAIYNEIYNFTAMLLTRYSGSGKSIFLGNWEGDWHVMREIYDYSLDPEPEAITGAIEWFRLREQAIADARRDTPHHDVAVYFYIELNHVAKSMDEGRPSIVNRVLPYIQTDYVSWSSYDVTKPAMRMAPAEGRRRVHAALDFIEARLPKSDVPGKRVFIGEYGFQLASFPGRETQRKYTAAIMKWSLEWGCPFVLYWELYCNEIDSDGNHRGYWLIDDLGEKQPVWYLHKEFLDKARAYVAAYEVEHGQLPPQEVYNEEAASWIEPFQTYNITSD